MSGGHFESLTAVNIYEVQNSIVSAQVIPERKKTFVYHGRTLHPVLLRQAGIVFMKEETS